MLNDFAAEPDQQGVATTRGGELVDYVMSRVNRWRSFRDGNYQQDWRRYDAIYRGKWDERLKVKAAERSKIITPATTSAVDQSVAEIIEAIFGRGDWFDVDEEGKEDNELQLAKKLQQQLHDDLQKEGIKQSVIHTVLNGAKYGTGIMKRIIAEKMKDGSMMPTVSWEPVLPTNFVIDTAAVCVYDAHGVAHETLRPQHEVQAKQDDGTYFAGNIGSATGFGSAEILRGPSGELYDKSPEDGVYITEYHGLVPRSMLDSAQKEPDKLSDPLDVISAEDKDSANEGEPGNDNDLVEAIVTIGNGSTLLKANENPIAEYDRGFVAYQHYPVPNRFWGMGIPEKAWNGQMALDGEIRARMDSIALTTYPSFTIDATRVPRTLDLTLTPGKGIRTNGRGSEIIEPIKFGMIDPANFQHSGDLERYVQMATGASDPSTSVNSNRSPQMAGATTGAGSMQFGSYIKRAKLPMQTIDEQFLGPVIRKSLLAYMTVDPDHYPQLFDFTVNSALSIMAREFEQMQLTNLMALLPQGSPEYLTVLKAIVTNYAGPQKAQLLQDIETATQPNPMQQQTQQLQLQTLMKQVQKLDAEINEINSRAEFTNAKAQQEPHKTAQKDAELSIQAAQVKIADKKAQTQDRAQEIGHTNHLANMVLKAHTTNQTTKARQATKAAAS